MFARHYDFPFASGDEGRAALAQAREKCPLQPLLNDDSQTQKDGRAVKALRDLHKRKSERRETRFEASIIAVYLEKAEAVYALNKPFKITNLTYSDMRQKLFKLQGEVIMWPPAHQVAFVTMERDQCVAQQDMVRVLDVCRPWCPEEGATFDPLQALLRFVNAPSKVRLSVFKAAFCTDVYMENVFKDESSSGVVISFSRKILTVYLDDDTLSMDHDEMLLWQDLIATAKFFIAVGGFELDADLVREAMSVAEFESKKVDRLQARALDSVQAAVWWSSRYQGFKKAAPTILEKGDRVRQHCDRLKAAACDIGHPSLTRDLDVMCSDFAAVVGVLPPDSLASAIEFAGYSGATTLARH